MSLWRAAEISFFHGATNVTPAKVVTIDTALEAIRTGAYRPVIERLRQLRTTRGEHAYKTAKTRLDAVTFCGTFAPTRAKSNLVQHSGLVHGDLDHLPDVQAVKQALCADPHTAYCFLSPGGDGLRLGVRVAPVADDVAYKHAWQAVANDYLAQYGVRWDGSGTDICRLCFVSWDADLYNNTTAQAFPVLPMPPPMPCPTVLPSHGPAVPRDRRAFYARQALDTATNMLDGSPLGFRHFWRRKAAYLLGGYVAGGLLSYDEAYAALDAAVARNSAHPKRSMKTIAACLAAGMQAAIRLEELERQRREWRAVHWHTRARRWTKYQDKNLFIC
jgi:hypothetical protein